MAQTQLKKCNTCNKNVGCLYCYECKEFLCDPCRKFHDKFTKGHCVEDAKIVDNIHDIVLGAEVTCKTHSQEFSYYCGRCLCLICDKCALDGHKQHKFCQIDEVATKTRENLQRFTAKVEKKTEDISDKIKKLETYKEDVFPNRKISLESAVKDTAKELVDIIKGVGEQTINDINTYFETESSRVESSLNNLKKQEENFRQVKKEIQQSVEITHDTTFLAIQRQDKLSLEDVPNVEVKDEENFDEDGFVRQCIDKIQAKKFNIYLNRDRMNQQKIKCSSTKDLPKTSSYDTKDRQEVTKPYGATDKRMGRFGYSASSRPDPGETISIPRHEMFEHKGKIYALHDNELYINQNKSWIKTNKFN